MRDIAKGLNVSVVTVSKVLRNQGKISVATRKRVLQRAKELNYQTNWIARSLVTRKTFTIGLLLPDFTHPFFAEVARAIAETVRPQGYHVIISYFEEDLELERTRRTPSWRGRWMGSSQHQRNPALICLKESENERYPWS